MNARAVRSQVSSSDPGIYLRFYGLFERPFRLTPDPRYLYLTSGHREALAQLIYGVQERKGFMQMTAEVGTGKTTLLRALLHRLEGKAAVAYVMNSTLPFDEVLEYILADFGVPDPGPRRVQRLMALNRFLIERQRSGGENVLIFDEAHNLDAATLEQIRLLSNFETTSDKLLQIILAGQPELQAKLARPDLRQLRQRITLRCTIPPMTAQETAEYIDNHLRLAGLVGTSLFTPEAKGAIAEYSRGIPRLVNVLSDHCLLLGYAGQVRRIDQRIVRRAIAYLEESERPSGTGWLSRWRLRGAQAAVGIAAAGVVGVAAVTGWMLHSETGSAVSGIVWASLQNIARWWGR